MIETEETREEFEKRREKARAAMKSAIRGELPFSEDTGRSNVTEPAKATVNEGCNVILCAVCEERRRKSRERVKRYREKAKK